MVTEIEVDERRPPAHEKTLVLHVRYVAARRPYVDSKADRDATLSCVKPHILAFFDLSEGASGGGAKTYLFALGQDVVSDLSVTLGQLARDHNELKLDLIERFEQG